MALINHNVSTPNDGLGDALRQAFVHQNEMNAELYADKVDKVAGKDLSSNDFTNTLKDKLDNIEDFAQKNVQADWLQADVNADDFIKNKPTIVNNLIADGIILITANFEDQEYFVNELEWYVNGQYFILPFSIPPLTFDIPLAGSGLQRIDLIYANNLGQVLKLAGVEDVTAVEPVLPPNSIRVTAILSTNTTSTPGTIDVNGFVQKIYFAYDKISADEKTLSVDGRTNFVIDSVLPEFKGFNGSTELFEGKRFVIYNDSGEETKLLANQTVNIPFVEELILPNQKSAEFDLFQGKLKQIGGVGSGGGFIVVTKSEIDALIASSSLVAGATYHITDADEMLYGGTSIFLNAISVNELATDGSAIFRVPNYNQSVSGFGIYNKNATYVVNDIVFWGGKVWQCIQNAGSDVSQNQFTLNSDFFTELPKTNVNYKSLIVGISYDIGNDRITSVSDATNQNYVERGIDGWFTWGNAINNFQWGNTFNTLLNLGIGFQTIKGNSLNENINFRGSYQIYLTFDNNSYQTNLSFENGSFQDYLSFDNGSRQSNLTFDNGSYQRVLTFDNISSQDNLNFENNSGQSNLTFDNSTQINLTFNNGSFQVNIKLTQFNWNRNNLILNGQNEQDLNLIGGKITGQTYIAPTQDEDYVQKKYVDDNAGGGGGNIDFASQLETEQAATATDVNTIDNTKATTPRGLRWFWNMLRTIAWSWSGKQTFGGGVNMSSLTAERWLRLNADKDIESFDGQALLNQLTITIELLDLLTEIFYAPANLKINSVTYLVNAPTINILVNDVAYTLGTSIPQGSKITIQVNTESVINLNGNYE